MFRVESRETLVPSVAVWYASVEPVSKADPPN
jgi:hypothetical protein